MPRIHWLWRSSRFYTESFMLQLHVLGSWSQPLGTVEHIDSWWIPANVSVSLCILTHLPCPHPCCQRIQVLILCCGFFKNEKSLEHKFKLSNLNRKIRMYLTEIRMSLVEFRWSMKWLSKIRNCFKFIVFWSFRCIAKRQNKTKQTSLNIL